MVSLASQLTLSSDRDAVDSDCPDPLIYHPSHSRDPLVNIPCALNLPTSGSEGPKDNADEE